MAHNFFLLFKCTCFIDCNIINKTPALGQPYNSARRQSRFPMFIPCQCQDANVLPKRQQSHQGDKLCDVSTVPLVARWPVFLARGSDANGEPHFITWFSTVLEENLLQFVSSYSGVMIYGAFFHQFCSQFTPALYPRRWYRDGSVLQGSKMVRA